MLILWSYDNNSLEHYTPSSADLTAMRQLASMYTNGDLIINTLRVTGNTTLTGDVVHQGKTTMTGDVTMAGNAAITGTTSMTGNVTMANNASVTKDLIVGAVDTTGKPINFVVHGDPTAYSNEVLRVVTADKYNAFLVRNDGKGTYGWYNSLDPANSKFINYFIGGKTATNPDEGGGELIIDRLTTKGDVRIGKRLAVNTTRTHYDNNPTSKTDNIIRIYRYTSGADGSVDLSNTPAYSALNQSGNWFNHTQESTAYPFNINPTDKY
jgi:hypothetical protein